MGRVTARVLAGVGSVPRVGRSARRCRTPGSGGANRLESSAGAMLGIRPSRRHVDGLLLAGPGGTIVGRSNKVSSGPLAWVMIHRHHAAAPDGRDSDHNAWVSFGKQGWVNSRERRRKHKAAASAKRKHKMAVSANCRLTLIQHFCGSASSAPKQRHQPLFATFSQLSNKDRVIELLSLIEILACRYRLEA